jgi:hypothetical protein
MIYIMQIENPIKIHFCLDYFEKIVINPNFVKYLYSVINPTANDSKRMLNETKYLLTE